MALPFVSVVMPVYNGLPFLDEAIESILNQSHADFRFAIYDDCSTDGSYERALEWAAKDPRISVARGSERLGPAGSSNAAAALAQTEFVARMDADDIAKPDRFEALLTVLQNDPDVVLAGSVSDYIDANGNPIALSLPINELSSAPLFVHSSVIYRRSAFDRVGGYRVEAAYFEDADLYARLTHEGKLICVGRPLVSYRVAGQHARVRDNPEAVLAQLDRQALGAAYQPGGSGRFSQSAFRAIAMLHIQAGQRPGLLGMMFARMQFLPPFGAVALIALVGCAEIAPWLAFVLVKARARMINVGGRLRGPASDQFVWPPLSH